MATINSRTLKAMEFCNSDRINGVHEDGTSKSKIIVDGVVHDWVGIGWVVGDPATDEDKKLYTELVNP